LLSREVEAGLRKGFGKSHGGPCNPATTSHSPPGAGSPTPKRAIACPAQGGFENTDVPTVSMRSSSQSRERASELFRPPGRRRARDEKASCRRREAGAWSADGGSLQPRWWGLMFAASAGWKPAIRPVGRPASPRYDGTRLSRGAAAGFPRSFPDDSPGSCFLRALHNSQVFRFCVVCMIWGLSRPKLPTGISV